MAFDSDARWRIVLLSVFILVVIVAAVSAPVTTQFVGWPWNLKALLTVALVAPLGFAMGIPFPTGLHRLERQAAPAVRWAWSINAASSVLGSASAIFLAIYVGLTSTLLTGGVCYLLALALSTRPPTRKPA